MSVEPRPKERFGVVADRADEGGGGRVAEEVNEEHLGGEGRWRGRPPGRR